MTSPRTPSPLRSLPRLDGDSGPAVPLSDDRMNGLVDAALIAATSGRRSLLDRRTGVRAAVVAVPVAATLASLAWAGVAHWRGTTARAAHGAPISAPAPVAAPSAAPPVAVVPPEDAPAERETTPPVKTEPRASAPRRSGETAEGDPLREANALRAERRWREAARAYEAAAARRPGTDDAYAALVAAAALRVEHLSDPSGALRLLATAERLRPGGALAQEIAYSRVESYRALGDSEDEGRAIDALLAAYPHSPWQAKLRARLQELDRDR